MSNLVVTNINGADADAGIAKVIGHIDMSTGTSTSTNVSSLTDNGTGNFTVYYTNPLIADDYPAVIGADNAGRHSQKNGQTTSLVGLLSRDGNNNLFDDDDFCFASFGDLA